MKIYPILPKTAFDSSVITLSYDGLCGFNNQQEKDEVFNKIKYFQNFNQETKTKLFQNPSPQFWRYLEICWNKIDKSSQEYVWNVELKTLDEQLSFDPNNQVLNGAVSHLIKIDNPEQLSLLYQDIENLNVLLKTNHLDIRDSTNPLFKSQNWRYSNNKELITLGEKNIKYNKKIKL